MSTAAHNIPAEEIKNTFQRYESSSRFVFGGIACMAASLVTNPVDVLKVRLQLVGERTHRPAATVSTMIEHSPPHPHAQLLPRSNVVAPMNGIVTPGFMNANVSRFGFINHMNRARLLLVQEAGSGYAYLYKGLVPSLLREGSYSTLRMGLYEPFKNLLTSPEAKDQPLPLWRKVIAGGVAGAVGAGITNPTDLVKVRMQAKANAVTYKSTLDAFIRIYREEGGIRGLYRGVGPTTQRAVLLTASQLASYDQSKQILIGLNYRGDSVYTHFLASFMAGFMCALTTSPIDLIKSRLMLQKDKNKYTGTWDCMFKTIKYEGFLGLYRGFMLNWLRMGPHTIVTFIVFEELRKLAGIKPL
ncbi:hypothetical protein K7432_010695 [Basidiobolus ranarum]|uniref:Uncharacterized protein n=1 Tax=Basidiobolus ranarum TaxID=34480 RepID=A0ABR2VV21_9FUNG